MFDIGFGELLVCAIVALLVLGPERLPGAVRTVGRWVGRARHTVNQFTDQIDREIRAEELKRRIEEEMKKAGMQEMTREVDDVSRQVKEALNTPLSIAPLVGADHLRSEGAMPPTSGEATTSPMTTPADDDRGHGPLATGTTTDASRTPQ